MDCSPISTSSHPPAINKAARAKPGKPPSSCSPATSQNPDPRLSGLADLAEPALYNHIASYLDPQSCLVLAGMNKWLRSNLAREADEARATVMDTKRVRDVRDYRSANVHLKRILRLPTDLQGSLLEAHGAHIMGMTGDDRKLALVPFLEALNGYEGPSALLKNMAQLKGDPDTNSLWVSTAEAKITLGQMTAEEAVKKYGFSGAVKLVPLLAAEVRIARNGGPRIGYGQLSEAMGAVRRGETTVKDAATKYGIKNREDLAELQSVEAEVKEPRNFAALFEAKSAVQRHKMKAKEAATYYDIKNPDDLVELQSEADWIAEGRPGESELYRTWGVDSGGGAHHRLTGPLRSQPSLPPR